MSILTTLNIPGDDPLGIHLFQHGDDGISARQQRIRRRDTQARPMLEHRRLLANVQKQAQHAFGNKWRQAVT